ncbi:hypothetical protein PQQ52_00525 [Paraburkholderia sediminicola]|uniref:hypothetical protein n=1 Tax=Paraburkholderia sediminicola TaxID=458836 RepID=UPI0038B8D49D
MNQHPKARLYVKNPEPQISAFTPTQLKREVLSKALSALSAGHITGTEATRLEAALSMGLAPQKELLQPAHFRWRAALESTGRPMAACRRRTREPSGTSQDVGRLRQPETSRGV